MLRNTLCVKALAPMERYWIPQTPYRHNWGVSLAAMERPPGTDCGLRARSSSVVRSSLFGHKEYQLLQNPNAPGKPDGRHPGHEGTEIEHQAAWSAGSVEDQTSQRQGVAAAITQVV